MGYSSKLTLHFSLYTSLRVQYSKQLYTTTNSSLCTGALTRAVAAWATSMSGPVATAARMTTATVTGRFENHPPDDSGEYKMDYSQLI